MCFEFQHLLFFSWCILNVRVQVVDLRTNLSGSGLGFIISNNHPFENLVLILSFYGL